jgi:hypothetical protein
MPQPKTPLIHPFNNFLVMAVERAYAYMANSPPQEREAIRSLYWLIRSLDKAGQKKLAEESELIENYLFGFKPQENKIGIRDYIDIYSAVLIELHEEQYFALAKAFVPANPNPKHITSDQQ